MWHSPTVTLYVLVYFLVLSSQVFTVKSDHKDVSMFASQSIIYLSNASIAMGLQQPNGAAYCFYSVVSFVQQRGL